MTKNEQEVEKALQWVESIRHSEWHSENEKKLILLADEVKRLRQLLKGKQK